MRVLPPDPLLYARAIALLAAAAFTAARGEVVLPLALAAIVLVAAGLAVLVRASARGAAPTLATVPVAVVLIDLLTAALWMGATAVDPHAVSFLLVLAAGALAIFRLGRVGIALTVGTYVAARIAQETIRLAIGEPTPTSQVIGEAILVLIVIVALAAIVEGYRTEQLRTRKALDRARTLERIALGIGGTDDPDAVLRSLPRAVRSVVDVEHASLCVRRGAEFEVIAGAGLAEGIVGIRAPTDIGIIGEVLRRRESVTLADYSAHPRAVPAVRGLGLKETLGVPILVHGEIAAMVVVARTRAVPFDPDEIGAVESFASHAAIAIMNARSLDQARRIEAVSRLVAAEGSPDEVVTRIAQEAATAFSAEFVVVVEIDRQSRSRVIAALGAAAPLAGRRDEELGPLAQRVVRDGKLVAVRDYVGERPDPAGERPLGRTDGGLRGAELAHATGLHAAVAAPAIIDGRVAAVLIVGTTDPHRSFDLIDHRGIVAFTESTAAALRAAAARSDRERRIQRLAALNVLAWELAQVREPLRIARLAWEACGQLVTRDSFYIARYDEERKRFHFLFQEDEGRLEESDTAEVWAGDMVVPLGTGPTSQVILTGEAYVSTSSGDEVQDRSRRYGDQARSSASAVHVPLKIGGRIVGVLSAQSYQPDQYDGEDVEVLISLANLVASAFSNAEHLARGRELYLASVKALAAAVDARDPYTRSHSARVAALSRLIAEELALPTDEIRRVQLGALLHDIGKIGIPDAILNKPAALSPDEWVIMKTHSALGASILAAVEPLRDLVQIVRCHHERFDGQGYPDGLRGSEIPLGSAIVTAADAYEVIVSKRSYKQAQSVDHAISELLRCRGSQFHPEVVDAFLRVIDRDRMHGTAQLRRVGSIEHEDIEDVPGPGEVLVRYAARSQAHTRQLAILQRLASEISAIVDIDDLAQRLLRIVCDSMGYENGFLTTLDDTDDMLVVRAAVGPSIDYLGHRLARGQGISWWVVEHGVLQNVRDVHADTRFLGPGEIRSSLIVPLRIGDERVGVLGIESTHTDAFSADDEELLTVVSHQVAAAVRVARLHAVAKSAAATDPLTSMPNRRAFFEHLELGLRRAAEGMPLSVAMVDVDLLKVVNDELGHGSGDEALVEIGRLLAAGVREDDVVARIGGDEFAIVFPGAPVLVAERIMRRLAESIARGTLGSGEGLPTISWGIAVAPEGRTTVDAIVDEADRAMYRHKELGRRRAHA